MTESQNDLFAGALVGASPAPSPRQSKPRRKRGEYDPALVEQALNMVREQAATGGQVFSDAGTISNYLRLEYAQQDDPGREMFGVVYLDARHQLIEFRIESLGSVDRAQVYPRQVLRSALLLNAAAMVLCHNHPSGNPEPSSSDIQLTERIKRLAAEVDVRLLDHIVLGSKATVSLAERGLI